MAVKDHKITTIEYALSALIKSLDVKSDKDSNIILSSAKRAKILINHIRIFGANDYEKSFDEFEKELAEKRNILLLTDEEVEEIEALRSMKWALQNAGFKIEKK